MKLTAILMVVACIQVSARSYSQVISFSGKNVPLQAVFASIEKQTGLSFFFNYALMKNTKPVTLELQDVPLEDALHEMLKGQGLSFYKTGRTIFIVKSTVNSSSPEAVISKPSVARLIIVKGKVTNQQGESLAGASVTVKNGKNGTLTDEKGMFELKGISENAVLEISYAGYQRREIGVDEDRLLTVQLTIANNVLDETQVIAYGQTTQRYSVGNVTTIKSDVIEKQPVSNPLLALEGQVPGLFITQNNGIPGGAVVVRIQGQNSIGNGNDPLYVVDGVPYSSQLLSTVSGGGGAILGNSGGNSIGGSGNPLNYINPNDIESISVLKDADATAIYGSRAANGAILIMTKKGKLGHDNVSLNLTQGVELVTREISLLNTNEYLQMRHEAKRNDNSTVSATDYDINGLWDTTHNTNWQKKFIGGTGKLTNLSGSVSGGSTNTQYLIGSTFFRETSVFPGSFFDQKGSVHFSLNNTSSNQKFHIQLTCTYLIDANHLPGYDPTSTVLTLAPDAPSLHNPDGSLNWAPNASGNASWGNPLANFYQAYKIQSNNLISNAILDYKILPGLDLKASAGYTNLQINELQIYPSTSIQPTRRIAYTRSARYSNNNTNSWIIEPQINYKRFIGNNKFDFLVGATLTSNNNNGMNLTGSGYNSDAVLSDIRSAANVTVNSSTQTVYKYNALFGRFNYLLSEKYILDITARRDGSSRFGAQNQFHNFGSVGAAWIFSEEKFMKRNASFINYSKFRISYGITGNDQISDYSYLNLYSPVSVSVPYQSITGLTVNGLTNPYYQWEETKKFQAGIDLGFLKDRIIFNGTYVYNSSSNELLYYGLPIVTGFNGIIENFPATLTNSSWEFAINSKNISSKNFNWTTSFNITIPTNKLASFPNLANSGYASFLIIGQPITIRKAYEFGGVNPTTGLYQFKDATGKLTSTPNSLTDQTVLINLLPKFYGGFKNTFVYKSFQVDILFQFVKQIGANNFIGSGIPGGSNVNQPTSVLNRWKKVGDIVSIQRFNSNYSLFPQYSYTQNSSAAFSDASFIRLKNFSIYYLIKEGFVRKLHMQGFRVFIQGQNLLTITSFKGLDPENQSLTSLPPLRSLIAGINASF